MLPSSHRLTTADIAHIMEKGRVAHTPLFNLRWVENKGHTRIAVLVPSKVVKKAVGRNKLRRAIYRSVRKIYNHIVPDLKIAILARIATVDQNPEILEAGLKEVLTRAKLLKS